MSAPKKCPECALFSPGSTIICDCGFAFPDTPRLITSDEEPRYARAQEKALNAARNDAGPAPPINASAHFFLGAGVLWSTLYCVMAIVWPTHDQFAGNPFGVFTASALQCVAIVLVYLRWWPVGFTLMVGVTIGAMLLGLMSGDFIIIFGTCLVKLPRFRGHTKTGVSDAEEATTPCTVSA
jgi:hypothetical protein